jgi:hypothetical protein
MITIKKAFITFTLLIITFIVYSQDAWTLGPMLHVNFGEGKPTVSYGIEGAYWDFSHFYYGIDGGFEFGDNKVRLYGELETGLYVVGMGMGPVLEYNSIQSKVHLGFQYSIWANYFLGLDYRKRWIDSTTYNCVGIYLKVPFNTTGFDNSTSSNTTTTTDHHHHHHWDWD